MSVIVKTPDGRYFFWSGIVDAPTSHAMTREELIEHVREEEGRRGVEELPARLARADAHGTSSIQRDSADDVMWLNRAGKGETPLTRQQIFDWVCGVVEEQPDGFHEPDGLPDDDPCGWTWERYMGRAAT